MRVFVKSFGCSTNLADGEVLAGCLVQAGHHLVKSPSEAEIIIYNTCAVKGPTENRMIEILKRSPPKKKLVVAGCLPLINFERLTREVSFDAAVGPAAGSNIVDVIAQVSKGEKVRAVEYSSEPLPALTLPRVRVNRVIGIVPINYGCLGSCAYCCVTFARGRLRSYLLEEVVERVKGDLASGACEFWLTSQDTACYGKDKHTNLAELLKAVCGIEGEFKVRVGMMTPNTALSILDELVEAFGDDHVFKFIHLPIQSGDNGILQKMHRHYSVEDFKKTVKAFRTGLPDITLSTDVICGFPGESDEAFKRTLQVVEEVNPDIVNVSKFFARPRTAAAEMNKDFVPLQEIKRRSSAAAALAKKVSLEKNKRWIGWTGEIIIDEVGKVSGSWIGRNFAYKPIAVKSRKKLLGKVIQVKVVRAFQTHLEGEIVED